MYETLLYEQRGAVALVTLNRPKAYNAINEVMARELDDAFQRIESDDSVRAAVITGGNKVFASGGDIGFMAKASGEEIRAFIEMCHKAYARPASIGKPFIAAVNGVALGGGCELALVCDIRICSASARFGLPEINLGIFPGAGGTQRLAAAVGDGWAKQMIFTGENIDAAKAEQIGLVQRVAGENPIDEALLLADKLAKKSPEALAQAKYCINYNAQKVMPEALQKEREAWVGLFGTPNQQEGMHAFLEKRAPVFR